MTLVPCKHCGGAAKIDKSIVDPHLCWSVSCQSCGITTAQYSRQDDAIDAWQRKAYAHRNGEKIAPTVEGRYWFYGEIDGRKKAEIFTVVSSPMLGVMEYDRLTVNDDGGVTFRSIVDFSGQWWGPLVAPWKGE